MTDRDRLIELLKPHVSGTACLCESGSCELTSCRDCKARRLSDHLLANGVIVPPVEVGDTVYFLARSLHTQIEKVKSGKVLRIAITENSIDLFVDNWTAKLPYGKRSFLTKEEAEQKLKELK